MTVKSGSQGESVKWLQWHINQCGNNLAEDGIWGPKTANALLTFQKSVFTDKKDWDCKCGPKTRAKLKEVL